MVIFLDVDGVLHPETGHKIFNESSCRLLAWIVKTTGASLVVSSTWRKKAEKMESLAKILQVLEVPPVVGTTPDFGSLLKRDAEICAWLDQHPGVEQWIAIDDMNLVAFGTPHAERLKGHFVNTRTDLGLQQEDAEAAVRLLLAPQPVA